MKRSLRRCFSALRRRVFPSSRKLREEYMGLAATSSEEEDGEEDYFVGGGVAYASSVFGDEIPVAFSSSSSARCDSSGPQFIRIADGPMEGTGIVQSLDKRNLDKIYNLLGADDAVDENTLAIKSALRELAEADRASRIEHTLASLRPEILRAIEKRLKSEGEVRETLKATGVLRGTNAFLNNVLHTSAKPPPPPIQPLIAAAEEEEEEEEEEEIPAFLRGREQPLS